MLYCRHVDGVDEPIFFQHRDGPILPTLKFVHKYPEVKFTSVTVDKGAIPFVLGGANIMCPGLTNVGEFCIIAYFVFLISHVEIDRPLRLLIQRCRDATRHRRTSPRKR